MTVEARGRLYCDDWEQASHGGEFTHASTGLAIQDLAIALVALEAAGELPDLPTLGL